MKLKHLIGAAAVGALLFAAPGAFAAESNKITPTMESVEVNHHGKEMVIRRAASSEATIPEAYSKTGRHCPPFCIQPMHAVPGVETLGELEVLGHLKRIHNGDKSVMVVDSRTPEWVARGTIPGSVNIPWNKINMEVQGTFELEAEAETLTEILTEQFGAHLVNGQWDFRTAKTLVLFCNGMWCPQSSLNIKTLVKLGYPPYKLKWYRGGMQDWVTAGLSTVSK